MSEDYEPEATSYTAELEITWEYFGNFVRDVEHKHKLKIENKGDEIKKPGIYKLISKDRSELYVGEGRNLINRLNKYRNARHELEETKEGTDRRIQGWMLRMIEQKKGPIEIFVCTEAYILCADEKKQKLDLITRHNRILIENLEISIRAKKFRIQNDRKNWEPRPAQSQIKTE